MNSEPRLLERARCTEHAHSVRRAAPQSYRKNTGKYSTTHSSENKAIFHRKSLRLNGNGGTGTVSLSETSIVQTDGPRHSGQPGRGGRPPNRLSPRPTAGVRRQVGTGGTAASRAARGSSRAGDEATGEPSARDSSLRPHRKAHRAISQRRLLRLRDSEHGEK